MHIIPYKNHSIYIISFIINMHFKGFFVTRPPFLFLFLGSLR